MWYRRDGSPCEDLQEFGRLFQDINYKRVKRDFLKNGKLVSTVWLGIDHGLHHENGPLIFETMVFSDTENYLELDTARYKTELEATDGHERMVKKWSL